METGSFTFGLSANTALDHSPLLQSVFSSYSSQTSDVQWIADLAEFAQSGIPQGIILAASGAWMAFALARHQRPISPKTETPSIQWIYEVPSQLSRIAAVAFLSAGFVQGRTHLLNVIILVYGFILGILRLCDLRWRQTALHQLNFVFFSMLIVLLVAYFLPCVEIGKSCTEDVSTAGGTMALVIAFAIAVTTPRSRTPPPSDFELPGSSEQHPAPEETSSWFAYYCTYDWINAIVWKGARRKLDMSGIPIVAWYDEPLYLLRKLQEARAKSRNTFWTLLRFLRKELTLMSLWVGLAFAVENIAPFGMFRLLEYLAHPEGTTYRPWVWLMLVFVGAMSRSLFFQQYIFTSTRLLVRVKSAMTQELYHEALTSMELEEDPFNRSDGNGKDDAKSRKTTSAGRLANLMAADIEAIYRARDAVQVFVGVPIGTVISVVGMYRMIGWPSLVGTLVLVLMVPVSMWLGRLMYSAQREVRKAQDSRISLVTEYLASIRAIKYFAWEGAVTDKIIGSRTIEQKQLWRVAVLQAIVNQVTQISPFIALLIMFGLHVGVQKQRLDASVAFTIVFLVKNIRRNITQASFLFRNFAAAAISFRRIDKYFETTVPLRQVPVGPLHIENASFRRNTKAAFQLEDISIAFIEGGLNVVSGQSGSGKTTLLLAILGETYIEGGTITRPNDVAFASQSAWLQNDTIEGNILFGSAMDRRRYDRVIEACCLGIDLREIAGGDQAFVGENGASLSGGQRARVALARSLYSQAPLLLLDDIFSALDAKTAAGLWKHCFCTDLLKGRTTVLVTQVPWIAEQGDLSITLDNGLVKTVEPNIGVVRRPLTIAEVLGGNDDDIVDDEPEMPPAASQPTEAADDKGSKDLVNQEMKASGGIGRMTVLKYMGYFGHPLFAISCVISLLACNAFGFYGSFWLSIWVEAYNDKAHIDVAYYMGIFALLSLSEILMMAAIIILFEWGAWRAARRLHNDFIHAIMRVSLSWFKIIPVGRITNRFSGDMAAIDSSLGSLVRNTLDTVVQLVFRIVAVSSIMPVFMIPAFVTCLFGIFIGELYTRTAVVIKRLMSSSQSPIFSHFADTLAGLPIIRSRAGMSRAFGEELANKVRVWSAAAETCFNCNRWVAVRVDFVTALVTLSAGIIAVSKAGLISAGLVGFSLTNANTLSQTILSLVRAMNDLEVEMQSFHRVTEYVNIDPEEKNDEVYPEEGEFADDETRVTPKHWPRSGDVEFKNVTIRYDPDGPNILSDVSLKFKAGERVAVVGRTGSGKSTLVLSLLRFTHVVSGEILYDGVDITKVPRRKLREGVTIIPQEAVLFNGSIESNLDPTGVVSEERLNTALDHCRGIASFSDGSDSSAVQSSANSATSQGRGDGRGDDRGVQLSTEVDARGENFSHGQRQVLSLCRALIRESKLMLLDEATASMDYETDRGIQQVLRDELAAAGKDRTLVTIAHRLRTIIDYDKVVVMSAGRVVECGSPRDLYNAKGQFHDMVYHSGELDELEELLEEKEQGER